MTKNKKENKLWKWDRTRVILKNPDNEEIILTSEHLGDMTMENIFFDIEEYVQKEGGKLE